MNRLRLPCPTPLMVLCLFAPLALLGCKDDPPPAAPTPADAAPPPPDAQPVDAIVDAQPPDASTDAQMLMGSTTIIKLPPPPVPGGSKNPKPKPEAAPSAGRVSIMGTIRRHQNEVIDCYAKVANSKPGVAGQLTLRWTLGASGKPTMAAVARNTLGDASVGRCVKDRSMKWQFPKPVGGTSVVKYTWNLALQ